MKGGYVEQIEAATGLVFTNSPSGPLYGGDLRWQTPYKPVLFGASLFVQHQTGVAPTGTMSLKVVLPVYYAQFDKGKFYAAGEYRRQPTHIVLQLGPFAEKVPDDQRQWYVMTSYHATAKLQLGIYYSHFLDEISPKNQQAGNSKDLVFSAQYDFNANFYAKAEDHFLHGTALGFYPIDNPQGLASRTDLVIGKIGFYF